VESRVTFSVESVLTYVDKTADPSRSYQDSQALESIRTSIRASIRVLGPFVTQLKRS
jgi:hypothetical protein